MQPNVEPLLAAKSTFVSKTSPVAVAARSASPGRAEECKCLHEGRTVEIDMVHPLRLRLLVVVDADRGVVRAAEAGEASHPLVRVALPDLRRKADAELPRGHCLSSTSTFALVDHGPLLELLGGADARHASLLPDLAAALARRVLWLDTGEVRGVR